MHSVTPAGSDTTREVVRVPLPTPFGEFEARAFEQPGGYVYLALVKGPVDGAADVLTRVHSECLTGDALSSLRCDCGVQLRAALRRIAVEGRGVVVYATGQEGRGIGLVNKLRTYVEQDNGADTFDANLRLGLEPDTRDYGAAAHVLSQLGVRSIRLLTNNPAKADGLQRAGIDISAVEPLTTASHRLNNGYLMTKQRRMGHQLPAGVDVEPMAASVPDVAAIAGPVRPDLGRPYVVLKYAQTLDGRIATASGDSKWISGEEERALSHALRANADAVLVGVETVIVDDPQLTVRMVPGASPIRVVLDSHARTPVDANVLAGDGVTVILTRPDADPERRRALVAAGASVHEVPAADAGVDLDAALGVLARLGIRSLLVEGGSRVITSLLAGRLVDRLIVAIAPTILGAGTDAVGALGAARVLDGIGLTARSVHVVGDDVVIAGDVDRVARPAAAAAS